MRNAGILLLLLLAACAGWWLLSGDPAPTAVARRPGQDPEEASKTGADPTLIAADAQRETRSPRRSSTTTAGEPDAVDPAEHEDWPDEWLEVDGHTVEEWLALDGLPKGTPVALRLGRGGPPDPLETGDASLELYLHDAESKAAFVSEVVLWRIGAPANRFWTAGDQDVARAKVGRDGFVFQGLAPGTYRVVVLDERWLAADQPELEVEGDARAALAVEVPRRRPVKLVLVGNEAPLPSLEARFHFVRSRDRTGRVPAWVRGRQISEEFADFVFEISEVDFESDATLAWEWLYPLDGAYDLKDLPENTRGTTFTRMIDLRRDGGEPREIVVQNPDPEPVRLTELVVSLPAN